MRSGYTKLKNPVLRVLPPHPHPHPLHPHPTPPPLPSHTWPEFITVTPEAKLTRGERVLGLPVPLPAAPDWLSRTGSDEPMLGRGVGVRGAALLGRRGSGAVAGPAWPVPDSDTEQRTGAPGKECRGAEPGPA